MEKIYTEEMNIMALKDWQKTRNFKDKDDTWVDYTHTSGKKLQIWRAAPNEWCATINGNFLIQDRPKSMVSKEIRSYMRRI
jgi:hypothetical protein